MSLIRVVIIGAGDHGRGTLEILRACNQVESRYDIVGFLDDDPALRRSRVGGVPVLAEIAGLDDVDSSLHVVVAIANCRTKRLIAGRLAPRQLRYLQVVHPRAIIAPDVELGASAIVNAGVVVAYGSRIGDFVTVNLNATVGHDCHVGSFSTIAPGANIAGRVHIGEGCDVGLNATVIKGISIGADSFVGPGTVVLKNIEPAGRVFGNPARVVLS